MKQPYGRDPGTGSRDATRLYEGKRTTHPLRCRRERAASPADPRMAADLVYLAPCYASLAAAGFQAIAVDPPGIGDSDKPRDGYDTGSIAVMLHTMMTQLGHSRYRLVGHDVGMWIGYAMASDFPQAVERLVLTEAVIPGLAPPPPIFVAPEENHFSVALHVQSVD